MTKVTGKLAHLASLLAAGSLMGCTPADQPAPCHGVNEVEFDGVIFSMESGSSTTSLAEDCPVFVSLSPRQMVAVSEAWKDAPVDRVVRPLRVRIIGRLEPPPQEGRANVLRVESIEVASNSVSPTDYHRWAVWRFGEDYKSVLEAE